MNPGFVVLVGATSDIARAVADELGGAGATLLLAGRDQAELEACAQDLRIRHRIEVATRQFEALAFEEHARWAADWCALAGGAPDGVVLSHGQLPDREVAATDGNAAKLAIDVNFTSAVSILTPIAERMAARGSGWIVGVSSVAGERGRRSNYVYGASKAGLSVYLDGLRHRLGRRSVHVITVKAGPVDTRMIVGRDAGPLLLVTSPRRVARGIRRAIERSSATVYTPWYWRPIMWVVRALPEIVFRRLDL